MNYFTLSAAAVFASLQFLSAQPCWTSVAASEFHTTALGSNGTVWSWGGNNVGQLGNGNNFPVYTPIQTGTDSDWREITCGRHHVLAIKTNGTLWAWGNNTYGELGNGNNTNTNVPV
ncbi:MAG: hypothetical protein ACK5Z2_08270, partial [Bacteroidota bacterium]